MLIVHIVSEIRYSTASGCVAHTATQSNISRNMYRPEERCRNTEDLVQENPIFQT